MNKRCKEKVIVTVNSNGHGRPTKPRSISKSFFGVKNTWKENHLGQKVKSRKFNTRQKFRVELVSQIKYTVCGRREEIEQL